MNQLIIAVEAFFRMAKSYWKEHPTGLIVGRGGEVIVPQSGRHPWHITYGSRRSRRRGYLYIRWKGKNYSVHRLVAECFLENNEGKKQIDHIDGNVRNNEVANLRWCTAKENHHNPITRERFLAAHRTPEFRQKISLARKNRGKETFDRVRCA